MKRPFLISTGIGSKKHIAFIALVFVSLSPVTVFSQEQQQEDQQAIDQPSVEQRQSDNNTGTLSTSPWPSSSSSSASQSTTGASGSNAAARPGATTALRPASGGTTLGRDPGGNPDVPFDDNMNLAFLVVGLVFAYVVYKKQLKSSDKANLAAVKK